ncbi:hypothetical protein [Microviridae sp.]|nr:hypothetical protein [Microviridae sp.]UOF81759.1 hypothetical protein [Microviridae sp.]
MNINITPHQKIVVTDAIRCYLRLLEDEQDRLEALEVSENLITCFRQLRDEAAKTLLEILA